MTAEIIKFNPKNATKFTRTSKENKVCSFCKTEQEYGFDSDIDATKRICFNCIKLFHEELKK